MISLGLKLAVSTIPQNALSINGFAFPNERLVAPTGNSYQWYVDDVADIISQAFTPTVYNIGSTLRCVVDGIECTPVDVWHPRDISSVKNFWWAARGAYLSLGNGYTDANRNISLSGFEILVDYATTDPNLELFTITIQNGKPFYQQGSQEPNGRYNVELGWDDSNQRWVLFYQAASDDSGENFSSMEKYGVGITDYPWQATWADGVVEPVATIQDVLASDGQSVTRWRDAITNIDVSAAGSNIALYEEANPGVDLITPALKFDSTDFFTIPTSIRSVFDDKDYCYIFAGAKDTAPTGGDSAHGVVSINRTSISPKLGLITRKTVDGLFAAEVSSNVERVGASSVSNANYNVLTAESLFGSGLLNLRVNSSESDSKVISTIPPNNFTAASYIGAFTSSSLTNFNGYITAVIFAAASDAPMSNTDRARVERFIGLLDGLNVAYDDIGAIIAPFIGSDDPENAAADDGMAYVLMDGPFYNSGTTTFVGGQSWRLMAPTDVAPYGKETYGYGDETVRYETGAWIYENINLGEIARAASTADHPWLANWNNGFVGAKVTGTYVKITNYPAI